LARRLKRLTQSAPALQLDLGKLTLTGEKGKVGLPPHETAMLNAFTRAPGQRLENWQLIELLGKSEATYSKASLDVQMFRLRKKLAQVGTEAQPIKVLRLLGYQLCVPVGVV